MKARIRGISTSLSAALIAANAIQINEMQRYNQMQLCPLTYSVSGLTM
jgi:hypothetical protein